MKKIALLCIAALVLYAGAALAAVNVNTATKGELAELPGIGGVKAAAIIEYREANGAFEDLSELMEVKGIGEATFNDLKDEATVGE